MKSSNYILIVLATATISTLFACKKDIQISERRSISNFDSKEALSITNRNPSGYTGQGTLGDSTAKKGYAGTNTLGDSTALGR